MRISKLRGSPALGISIAAMVMASTGIASGQLPNPLPLQAGPSRVVATGSGEDGRAFAPCPSGWKVTGGGGSSPKAHPLTHSRPFGEAWQAGTGEFGAFDPGVHVEAFAVCELP
jgi:hypothetical protein